MAKSTYPIPPKGVVRFLGVLMLALSCGLFIVCLGNISALGAWGYVGMTICGLGVVCASMAIKTGNPEWLLLDLVTLP